MVLEIIKARRSVRTFQKRVLERDKIRDLIEAAQWAPSASNKQLWEFVVVEDNEVKRRLVQEAGAHFFLQDAPCAIYVIYAKNISGEFSANIQSAAGAVQNMLLQASATGLGACCMAACGDRERVRHILRIPKRYVVVSAVLVGYPLDDASPRAPKRRMIDEIFHENYFDPDKGGKFGDRFDAWDLKGLADFRSRGIRATDPFRQTVYQDPTFKDTDCEGEVALSLPVIREKDTVLDLLSFKGAQALELLRQRPSIRLICSDVSDEILEFIRTAHTSMNLPPTIELLKGSLENSSVPPASVDVVTCFRKIDFFKQPDLLLSEARRSLKPHGRLVLSFLNHWCISTLGRWYMTRIKKINCLMTNQGPIRTSTFGDVTRLVNRAGFRVEESFGLSLVPRQLTKGRIDLHSVRSPQPIKYACKIGLLRCRKR